MDNPENRRQLFFFTWRTQKTLLLKISLAVSLFILPLLFTEGLRGVSSAYFAEDPAGRMNLDSLVSLLYIPAWLVLSVGLCGCFGVMKAYTFQEGVWFFLTFRESLQENAGQSLKLSLLFSVLYYLIHFAANSVILQMPQWELAVKIAEAALLALWLGAWIFGLCQIPIYKNGTLRTVKNAWLFTFARMPGLLAVLLAGFLPLRLVWFFGIPQVSAAVLLVYILLGFGHSILLSTLFCQSCFDEIVNKTHYPGIYRRGLYDPKKDETPCGVHKISTEEM